MIEIKNISKKYNNKVVLNGISLEVTCGQSIAVVGKNGCGKTTLMRIMAGIIKPDSGSISYFGKNTSSDRRVFREFCGYVPQENPLIEELSVYDNLQLWGLKKGSTAEKIISWFQLEGIMKKPVYQLSGGMKRRLSIACAIIEWQPILIMDEPTTALDLYYKDFIHSFMRDYTRKNGIIILTTHDEEEIRNADRCIVMNDGHFEELDKTDDIMSRVKECIMKQ